MKDFNEYLTEAKRPAPIVYCDMDGVLADFVRHIGNLYGVKLTSKTFDSFINPRKPEIDKNYPHLFGELPLMKGALDLWRVISKHDVRILSAYPSSWQSNAKSDKVAWVKKTLTPQPTKIHTVLRHEKQLYAMTNGVPNILIDDFDKNIAEWEAAGGIGIKHTSASTTLARLKELGIA
jgi:hypothetical protein